MSAPAVVIRLELEAVPRLLVDAINEEEHDRLLDWIESHPRYRQLIQDALALRAGERAT